MAKATVYIIGWDKAGPVKVGRASNPVVRLAELQCAHPYRLRIWFAAVVEATVAHDFELATHRFLHSHRLTGEWFNVSAMTAHAALVKVIHEAEGTVERWRPHPNALLRRQAQLKGRSAVSQLHKTVKVNEERENAAVEMRKWQRKQYSSG